MTASRNASSSPLQTVDARCLGVPHRSRQRQAICDISDGVVGECSIMPGVYIQDKILALREAPLLTLSERIKRLKKAGDIYRTDKLAGLEPEAYVALLARITGLPPAVILASLTTLSQGLGHMREILQAATPQGAVWEMDASKVQDGCSFFSRRGEVVSIIAAGNGPGVHGLWPQAIAMGYRTLVRPSLREPFTAERLVLALEQAGLADYVALIPTDHKGAETLISKSDLAIVYGGPTVAAQYRNNSRVLVQGPGRSKIIVGKDVPHDEAIAIAAESVLSLGGAACVSASAILVEDNPAAFAVKLRHDLALRSPHPSLTRGRLHEARQYEKQLETDDIPWMYNRHSETCLLKPHVAMVKHVTDPEVQRELPFPCVTIAPFHQLEDCYKALSGSLVVTVLSRQIALIQKVLADASIANVYIGNIPTSWMDYRVPHDGYLADFLMCNRGIRMEANWLTSSESLL